MKKVLIVLLMTILAFASAGSGAEIDDLPWNEANIKTLRALKAGTPSFDSSGRRKIQRMAWIERIQY